MQRAYAKTLDEYKQKPSKFWINQPVPKPDAKVYQYEQIKDLQADSTPLKLLDGFEWSQLDIKDEKDTNNIREFLENNYDSLGKNNGEKFRMLYSNAFLKWLICDRALNQDDIICLGVRVKSNNMLVGFVVGIPMLMQIGKNQIKMLEVNLLCVHKKLRTKALASVIIKELTRQACLKGYQQAIFSGIRYTPKPFVTVNQSHRALNIQHLIDTGFTSIENNLNMKSLKKALRLPESVSDDNFIPLTANYLTETYDVFNNYLKKYTVHPIFTLEQFKNTFLGNKFVVSYVLFENDHVIDFVSYYKLPTKVMAKPDTYINTAYLFYYSANQETAYRMIRNIMIIAKNKNIDLFNALDIMENEDVFKDLNFEQGPTNFHDCLYNYSCPELENFRIAYVNI